jgi:hypothetical protein
MQQVWYQTACAPWGLHMPMCTEGNRCRWSFGNTIRRPTSARRVGVTPPALCVPVTPQVTFPSAFGSQCTRGDFIESLNIFFARATAGMRYTSQLLVPWGWRLRASHPSHLVCESKVYLTSASNTSGCEYNHAVAASSSRSVDEMIMPQTPTYTAQMRSAL